MNYRLEQSGNGQDWWPINERRIDRAEVPVMRHRLDDIQREAEFYSHRYPHTRIIHPTPD